MKHEPYCDKINRYIVHGVWGFCACSGVWFALLNKDPESAELIKKSCERMKAAKTSSIHDPVIPRFDS
jgi:hypothetical protein